MATFGAQDREDFDDDISPPQKPKEGHMLHVKIYCKHCGELLLHTREEISGKTFISVEVEPCIECMSTFISHTESTRDP